jgi:bacterioferritin-associated ferredoxin
MIKNINSQTWPIRVSSLSNFLLGGLVAGCLVIGIAYLVESRKRTVIEEQFFTEVKELPAHELEEIIKNAILKIMSESKKVKNELLSDQKEAIKSSGSSLKSLTAKIGIKNKCSKCDELMAKRESIERDIRAKTPGLRFVKN